MKQIVNLEDAATSNNRLDPNSSATITTGINKTDVSNQNFDLMKSVKRRDNFVSLISGFLESEYSLTYDKLIPTLEFVSSYVGGITFKDNLPHAFKLDQ
jgi:hypothetical protein